MSRKTPENRGERDHLGRFIKGSKAAVNAGRKGGIASTGSFVKGSERARRAGQKGGRS